MGWRSTKRKARERKEERVNEVVAEDGREFRRKFDSTITLGYEGSGIARLDLKIFRRFSEIRARLPSVAIDLKVNGIREPWKFAAIAFLSYFPFIATQNNVADVRKKMDLFVT